MSLRVAIGPSSFADKDKTPLKMLEDAGVEVVPNPFGRRLTEDEIIAHLKEIDGLIAGLEPLNRKVQTAAAPRLKAIARVGIGTANVDFDAAHELGIKVSSTPEGPTAAVAEMTLTAMLALLRRIHEMSNRLHAGEWPKLIADSLVDLPVLLVGYGRIGRRVGGLLRAFGARVFVADPMLKPADLTEGEQLVSLHDGLASARVVSLHAAGEQCILGPAEFAMMADGILILNSARGGLVDESALVAALESGRVAGGWFDAFWKEPYTGPLLRFPRMLLTPHVGTYTEQCRLSMETAAVANLLRDLGISR
jgi:D-3-phosphoglycerate dehydrogenase